MIKNNFIIKNKLKKIYQKYGYNDEIIEKINSFQTHIREF